MAQNLTDASQLGRWLAEAQQAVVFTGAGISTESGIPDFRSPGGVWSRNQPVYFAEFMRRPDARYEYWRQKAEAHADFARAKPNLAHHLLAKWEASGRLQAIITQNIDGLHQMAGSSRVLELHGTARKVSCLDCGEFYDAEPMVEQFLAEDRVPTCTACGTGRLKHATVSFGQSLPHEVWEEAVTLCQASDLLFALGSSLVVEPAASLPRLAKESGARLIIVNREPTPLDGLADMVLHSTISEALAAIDAQLGPLR